MILRKSPTVTHFSVPFPRPLLHQRFRVWALLARGKHPPATTRLLCGSSLAVETRPQRRLPETPTSYHMGAERQHRHLHWPRRRLGDLLACWGALGAGPTRHTYPSADRQPPWVPFCPRAEMRPQRCLPGAGGHVPQVCPTTALVLAVVQPTPRGLQACRGAFIAGPFAFHLPFTALSPFF